MNIIKKSFLISIFMTYGCSQQVDRCAHFASRYPRITLPLASFSEVPFDAPVIKKSIMSISECYPKHTYMGFDHKIQIHEALQDGNGKYFVIAQLDGVSDLILVFEVDDRGRIIGSYQSSTL